MLCDLLRLNSSRDAFQDLLPVDGVQAALLERRGRMRSVSRDMTSSFSMPGNSVF
jgi:hypothetical protein